ncbi:MAG: molybdopterin-guanine dinucleotide biosynthesis protein B [Alphaproteobacteria bacterium]|nr:MAG: molybdopterin-guanine dinucleotide biosynthesis protein B [Alphaproteobacteria bacterium]
MVRLVQFFTQQGITVSTVKHAHHGFDVDQPGKDSFLHREAGAREVLVASANRFALMHELRGQPEPGLDELLARLSPVSLVLVEGFKAHSHPKLEVYRRGGQSPLVAEVDKTVVAVATDVADLVIDRPVLPLDDTRAIASFIATTVGLDLAQSHSAG